nr:hypothetical protein [uncultured Cohaesibacter sp.]
MPLNSARDIASTGIGDYTSCGLLDANTALTADPAFFIESRISGVTMVRKDGKPVLRVIGVANTSSFAKATLYIGEGANPDRWLRLKTPIRQTAASTPLIDLPAPVFKGSKR